MLGTSSWFGKARQELAQGRNWAPSPSERLELSTGGGVSMDGRVPRVLMDLSAHTVVPRAAVSSTVIGEPRRAPSPQNPRLRATARISSALARSPAISSSVIGTCSCRSIPLAPTTDGMDRQTSSMPC